MIYSCFFGLCSKTWKKRGILSLSYWQEEEVVQQWRWMRYFTVCACYICYWLLFAWSQVLIIHMPVHVFVQLKYRDRAKERREKYGSPAIIPGWKRRLEREIDKDPPVPSVTYLDCDMHGCIWWYNDVVILYYLQIWAAHQGRYWARQHWQQNASGLGLLYVHALNNSHSAYCMDMLHNILQL